MSAGQKPAVRFIRVHGRVVPITEAAGGAARGAVGGAAIAASGTARHQYGQRKVQAAGQGHTLKGYRGPNKFLAGSAIGLGITAGAVSAASLVLGKGASKAVGLGVGEGLAWGATALGAASVAGRGHAKDRAKDGAKVLGAVEAADWGLFAAGSLGTSTGRAELFRMGKASAGAVTGAVKKFGAGLAWTGQALRKVAL